MVYAHVVTFVVSLPEGALGSEIVTGYTSDSSA